LVIAASAFVTPLAADQVGEWNNALLDQIRETRTPPPRATRAMAIVHVSIHDAASSIDGRFETYRDHGVQPAGEISIEAAIAAAGYTALSSLYPETDNDLYLDQLAAIAEGTAKTNGIAWGTSVATDILEERAEDGAALALSYSQLGG